MARPSGLFVLLIGLSLMTVRVYSRALLQQGCEATSIVTADASAQPCENELVGMSGLSAAHLRHSETMAAAAWPSIQLRPFLLPAASVSSAVSQVSEDGWSHISQTHRAMKQLVCVVAAATDTLQSSFLPCSGFCGLQIQAKNRELRQCGAGEGNGHCEQRGCRGCLVGSSSASGFDCLHCAFPCMPHKHAREYVILCRRMQSLMLQVGGDFVPVSKGAWLVSEGALLLGLRGMHGYGFCSSAQVLTAPPLRRPCHAAYAAGSVKGPAGCSGVAQGKASAQATSLATVSLLLAACPPHGSLCLCTACKPTPTSFNSPSTPYNRQAYADALAHAGCAGSNADASSHAVQARPHRSTPWGSARFKLVPVKANIEGGLGAGANGPHCLLLPTQTAAATASAKATSLVQGERHSVGTSLLTRNPGQGKGAGVVR